MAVESVMPIVLCPSLSLAILGCMPAASMWVACELTANQRQEAIARLQQARCRPISPVATRHDRAAAGPQIFSEPSAFVAHITARIIPLHRGNRANVNSTMNGR